MFQTRWLCVLVLLFTATLTPMRAQDITLSNAELCRGDSINLSSLVNANDQNLQKVNGWSAGGQTLCDSLDCYAYPTSTTTYTLSYVYSGESRTKDLTITVYQTPDFTIPSDAIVCSGTPLELRAVVHNSCPTTTVNWKDDRGNSYPNNAAVSPANTTLTYRYTATVRNNEECTAVEKTFSATVQIKPTGAVFSSITTNPPYCRGASFNLNDHIRFDVVDNYGNKESGTFNRDNITWHTTYNGPSTVSAQQTISSPGDKWFFVDYNGVEVTYNSEVCGTFSQPVSSAGRPMIPISVSSSTFTSVLVTNSCTGSSSKIIYRLIDAKTGNASTCDSIVNIDTRREYDDIVKTNNNTQWEVSYSPLIDVDDSFTATVVSASGASGTFAHRLEPPVLPHPNGGVDNTGKEMPYPVTVCKGDNITFYITANECDTIYSINDIKFDGAINNYGYDIQKEQNNRYRIVVPNVTDDVLNFNYHIDYYSNYYSKMTVASGSYSLRIYCEKPLLTTTVNGASFNAYPNLCLGDVLTFDFSPGPCDNITGISWNSDVKPTLVGGHQYTLKPEGAGTFNLAATVTYRRPNDNSDSTYTRNLNINVVERPRLFINDTVAFCHDSPNSSIDLSSTTNNIIDYTFIKEGSAYYTNYGTSIHALKPLSTNNYNVTAAYKHTCSEMTTGEASGILRIIADTRNNLAVEMPRYPDFCEPDGIDIPLTTAEGVKIQWTHDGTEISFPYMKAAGTYTLVRTASNSCVPDGESVDVSVAVVPAPHVEAMPDTAVCFSEVMLRVLPGHVGQFQWEGLPGENPVVPVNQTTTFTVTAYNTCGTMSDTVVVTRVSDPVVQTIGDVNGNINVCYGDSLELILITQEGNISWRGRNGELSGNPPKVKIIANETFWVTAGNQCDTVSARLNVTSVALPFVDVAPDTNVCYGEHFIPDVRRSVGDLVWQPVPPPDITGPASFVVTATVKNCGSYNDTMHVDLRPSMTLEPATIPTYKRQRLYTQLFNTLEAEQPVSYRFEGTLPLGMWFTPAGIEGTPELGPNDYNTYNITVEATDAYGCKVAANYALQPEWSVATAFTPLEKNNSIFLPGFQVEIYNRNGILIYKSDEGASGWDGSSNGTLVSAGTYFYKATVIFDGVAKQYTGYTTVMYR